MKRFNTVESLKNCYRNSRRGTAETNPTRNHEVEGLIPGLAQWVKGPVSCGVGRRHGLDLALLWLWCRLAAVAPIGPLAWECPHAVGATLEKAKRQKKQRKSKIVMWEEAQLGRALLVQPTPVSFSLFCF